MQVNRGRFKLLLGMRDFIDLPPASSSSGNTTSATSTSDSGYSAPRNAFVDPATPPAHVVTEAPASTSAPINIALQGDR